MMLTYACVRDITDVMRVHEKHARFNDSQWAADITLVFEDDDLILIFNNRPRWEYFMENPKLDINDFGRWMERRIRLMLKLRARRVRLRAKQCRDTTPQKQSTSEARPAT